MYWPQDDLLTNKIYHKITCYNIKEMSVRYMESCHN